MAVGEPTLGREPGGWMRIKDTGVASFEVALTLNKASLSICFLAHKPCL